MGLMFVADDKKEYDEWLMEFLNDIRELDVDAIAIVCLGEEETTTGYYNIDIPKMQVAQGTIGLDITAQFIEINMDRFIGTYDSNEMEDDDD